jgi:hypothetical protein
MYWKPGWVTLEGKATNKLPATIWFRKRTGAKDANRDSSQSLPI